MKKRFWAIPLCLWIALTLMPAAAEASGGAQSLDGVCPQPYVGLAPPPKISSVSVASPPTGTSYAVGEWLDPAGMSVVLNYDDGTAKTVQPNNFAAYGLSFSPAGPLTLSDNGKAVTVHCDTPGVEPACTEARLIIEHYGLWVNNVQITPDALSVTCGAGTAVYSPESHTLTLTNAEITEGCQRDFLDSGIVSFLPELTIVLVGENSITNTGGEGISTYQDKCYRRDLTLRGGGKLTIAQDTPWCGYGVYCTGDLTLSGVTLDIDSAMTGLWAQWRLDITDCMIDIDVTNGAYGMLTGVGGSAPEADKDGGEGVISAPTRIHIVNGRLMAINAPAGSTFAVACYTGGRMADMKTAPAANPIELAALGLSIEGTDAIKVFLLGGGTYAPLCAAAAPEAS